MTVPRMSKHRVAVLKVISSQLSVTAAAAEYGISRGYWRNQRRDPGRWPGSQETG